MKTLFYGGTIITMDDAAPNAEAVLVENGTILAVGTKEDLLKQAGECQQVDLHGQTMLPGFIDPHSHFFQVATSLLQVSLNGAKTPEEIGQRINAFLKGKELAPGQWVVARDYDNNLMPGLKHPTLEELDSYTPGHPLVIHHKSGHMGLMNSMGLEAVGITADTPSPDGGRIELRDGKLTGYLEENAFITAIRKMPMMKADELLSSFTEAQKKYTSYGITTVQEGMVAKEMLPMYRCMIQQKTLYLDVVLYPDLASYQETKEMVDPLPSQSNLHVGGLKIFLDGSPQGRTAWMRQSYVDDPAYFGYATMTDEAVEHAFERAAQEHTQLLAHCNGDAASEQFLRCLEKVEKDHPELKDLRPVIIHGQLLGRDQLPRVKKLGAMVSFFVAHVYHWGDVHLRNFGPERANHISPTKSALDSGVTFTFHQDAPVIEPDMLETIWCATNRMTKNSVLLGEEERISTMDALKAITVNAAYQYSMEDSIGSITPGKHADFVVLDRNPLEVPADALRDIHVEQTYKNGKCVFTRQ